MDVNFFVALFALAIVKAAPLVYGALCGLLGERAGVINIGIEGMMLWGAFTAFLGSALFNQWTGGAFPVLVSLLVGLVFSIISTAFIGLLHAVLSIHYQVDQVISGTVINLLAVGFTNYVANVYIDPTHLAGVGVFPKIPIPFLSKIPILGPILFSHQPMIYLMFGLVIFLQYAVFNTPWGLRLRSVGEHPSAADTVGIAVNRTRYKSVIWGSVLAALGGAILILESVGRFQKLVTSGRGFIALAVLIFGRWNPLGALGAAVLFGFAEALGVRLQFGDINHIFALLFIIGVALLITGLLWLIQKVFQNKSGQDRSPLSIAVILILGFSILGMAYIIDLPDISVPIEFLGLLPYLLTIFVLTGLVKRAEGPAAIGSVYEKS